METGTSETLPLPRRDGATRCEEADNGRRCVLPLEHEGEHLFPRHPDT